MKWRRGKKNRQKEPRCWIGDPSGIVKPSLITKHAILPFFNHSLKTSTTRLIPYKSDCVTITALAAGCCTNNISQQETQQSLTAAAHLQIRLSFYIFRSDLLTSGSLGFIKHPVLTESDKHTPEEKQQVVSLRPCLHICGYLKTKSCFFHMFFFTESLNSKKVVCI